MCLYKRHHIPVWYSQNENLFSFNRQNTHHLVNCLGTDQCTSGSTVHMVCVRRFVAIVKSVIVAERLSARQLILRRISEIVCMYVCMFVCMYVCMYVSVTLRNPIISRATRKRSITRASVNILLSRPSPSARRRSPSCTTIVRDVGDAVRTQRSGGQPEYEPIRAACNRLAQLSTCTYLLQRLYESGARRVYTRRPDPHAGRVWPARL